MEEKNVPKSNLCTSNIVAHVIRLLPGQDLYKEIRSYVHSNNIQACFIMTCVGSLKKINIRLASGQTFLTLEQNHEIVSLVGNVSLEREHLHITLSDETGKAIGGHLLDGNLVYTTAEIVLGVLPNLKFTKEICEKSGWEELVISKIN
jgi:predicted DNA-binding protein with PD1-like motif